MTAKRTQASPTQFEAAAGLVCSLSFREVDLRTVKPPADAVFQNCDFSGAIFHGLDLSGLEFRNCLFQQADLSNSILLGTRFLDGCDFSGASLKEVEAEEADFSTAILQKAIFTGSVLTAATFTGSKVQQSIFDRADLTDALNFSPDRTKVLGTVFSGRNVDNWTALRGEYTGLNMFISSLPPIVYALSMLVEAYSAVAVSAFVASSASDICGSDGILCPKYPIWQILMGFREGTLAIFFVGFSILYNAVRLLLTLRVSKLASAEDRSHFTPSLGGIGGYGILRRASIFVSFAKWAMLALFAVNMFGLLTQTIVLPPTGDAQ